MQKLSIKKNNQCSVNIPKDLLDALGWKDGDAILFSKMAGKSIIIIENVTEVKKEGK